jgi:dienelactone hydrolase
MATSKTATTSPPVTHAVRLDAAGTTLDGDLTVPVAARGLILFAHGSGSSRHSPRNQYVARVLNASGLATLLMDLLTPAEEAIDEQTRALRFDIGLLARRLVGAVDWAATQPELASLPIGTFGASTGAAAALIAAANRPLRVGAVVSRGGRPDLAGDALPLVKAPTLLIVGGFDETVLHLNRQAEARMTCTVTLTVIPGATHLFEEPGTLAQAADAAAAWFRTTLTPTSDSR